MENLSILDNLILRMDLFYLSMFCILLWGLGARLFYHCILKEALDSRKIPETRLTKIWDLIVRFFIIIFWFLILIYVDITENTKI